MFVETQLVGGISMPRYADGRNTGDIDLLMSLPSVKVFPRLRLLSVGSDILIESASAAAPGPLFFRGGNHGEIVRAER